MAEESIEPIDNLLGLIETASEKDKRNELIEVISDYINVTEHSFRTNYLNKRSYDKFKVRMAIPVAQNFVANLEINN